MENEQSVTNNAAPSPTRIAERQAMHSRYWDRWIGKRMFFQMRNPNQVVGTLKEFRNGFLELTDATVTGTQRSMSVNPVLIDRNFIAHYHEVVEAQEPKGETERF